MHNIGYSTLQKWIRKVRNGDIIDPVKSVKNNQVLPLSWRFTHLMATASLDETAVGIYCREHGLYVAVPTIKKYPANSRIIDDLEINFS